MTIFDWVIIAILALSTLAATMQGLLREAMSLAGLVIGLWLAFWNYHALAAPLERFLPSHAASEVVAFLLIALGVMLVVGLLGRVVSAVVHTVGLGALDRLLGAVFGLVRGCVLVVLALIVIAAFLPQRGWIHGSKLAPYFLSAADWASGAAPAELRLRIRDGIETIKRVPPTWLHLDLHPPPGSR